MKEKTEITKEFIDPICGMKVSPEKAAASLEFNGEEVYFCSKLCFETFKRQNNIEDAAASETQKTADSKVEKHIDPICGMTVTPENAAAKYEHENGETIYFCAVGCKNKYVSQLENGENKIYEPAKANVEKRKR